MIEQTQILPEQKYLLMDRAYERDNMRRKAEEKGFSPVVPTKSNRKNSYKDDKKLYKQRNKIERYFLRLKRFGMSAHAMARLMLCP